MGAIQIKSATDIAKMREAGRLASEALWCIADFIKAGVTTKELDNIMYDYITKAGGKPSFLGLYDFPGTACISLNEQLIHGIPSKKVVLKDGDIVSVDVGAFYDGFHGDNAYTFTVGDILPETQKLLDVTKECLELAIKQVKPKNRIGDISNAVQKHAESFGFGVVKEYVGHGIGKVVHEAPEVPNFGKPGRGVRLTPGMTIAIEPMINMAGAGIKELSDGWTIVAVSGKPSAHFEHTVLVTEDGCEILTLSDKIR